MDSWVLKILFLYVAVGALGAIAFFGYPIRQPDLDNPSDWRRAIARLLGYAVCNLAACLVLLLLVDPLKALWTALGGTTPTIPPESPWRLALLLLAPIPFALAFFSLLLRFNRWIYRNRRGSLRRAGLVPEPRVRPDTPPMASYRATNFSTLDLQDDEIVRELARGHWQAMQHAVASGADVTVAQTAQRRFLDEHLAKLEPAVAAHAREVYTAASVAPSREMARVSALQLDKTAAMLKRRKRVRRNYVFIVLLLFVSIIVKWVMGWH